jgi:hypothetical protein
MFVISSENITFDGEIEKGMNFPNCQSRYKFMRIMYGIVMYRGFHGTSQDFPEQSRGFPETSQYFLERSRNFPETSRYFLEQSRNFLETSQYSPERSRNFPETSQYFLEQSRNFSKTSQYFPDKAGLMFKHVQEVISDGISVGKTELHHESTFGEFLVLQIEFLIITIINYEN